MLAIQTCQINVIKCFLSSENVNIFDLVRKEKITMLSLCVKSESSAHEIVKNKKRNMC
jgi:hypothetical protein